MSAERDLGDGPVAGDLRARATGGAALLGARGLFIYAFGVVANVALARLLAPRDFGIFALGMAVVMAGALLAEGGFGGALIQRDEPPRRSELRALTGLQLGVTLAVAAAAGLAAIPLGRDAELIFVMALSLPLAILKAPTMVVLERRLEYRLIATADIVEALVFYVSAIALVAAGLGVWGLALGVVLRAAAGAATLLIAGPVGLLPPGWSWPVLRPLVGFGLKLQAGSLVTVAREQLVNIGVALVAGLGTLGVWTLAWRVMQVPALLFQTVGRVAFPAMSRLLGAGRDPRPVLERQVAVVAAANAVVVVGIVGFAPALPAIVGDDWGDVPEVLLWSGVALVLASAVVVSAAGYLLAAGMPGVIVTASAVAGVVWLAVTLPLLDPVGAAAVGLGWVASGIVNALLLWRPVAARTGASLSRTAPPIAVALVALAAGWFVANAIDERVVGGLLGLAVAEAILLAGLVAFSRQTLDELRALARQGMRGFRPG